MLIKGIALLTFYYPLRWFLLLLDRRKALKIGRMIGEWHARFMSDELRRRIEKGIRTVWSDIPEKRLNELVRQNLVTRYVHLIDLFFTAKLKGEILEAVPVIEGKRRLDDALSEGRGAILLGAHFGSFGLMTPGFSFRGYRTALVKTISPRSAYQTWKWAEKAALKVKIHLANYLNTDFIIWRPGMYARVLYRKLTQGEVLIFHSDVFGGRNTVPVEFLGCPILLSAVPFKLAARMGVKLIPAFVVRQPDDRHRIVLLDPIDVSGDIREAAHRYAAALARYVREHPDHWFTFARLKRVRTENGDALEILPGWTDDAEFDEHRENRDWVNKAYSIKRWK